MKNVFLSDLEPGERFTTKNKETGELNPVSIYCGSNKEKRHFFVFEYALINGEGSTLEDLEVLKLNNDEPNI